MSSDDKKWLAFLIVAVVIGVIGAGANLTMKQAALERATGRPVSLWDTFILTSK